MSDTTAGKRPKSADGSMTIREHLVELRSRIIRSVLAVVVGGVVLLVFYDQVLRFLVQPYVDLCNEKPDLGCGGELVVLGPLDGFTTRVRIAGGWQRARVTNGATSGVTFRASVRTPGPDRWGVSRMFSARHRGLLTRRSLRTF